MPVNSIVSADSSQSRSPRRTIWIVHLSAIGLFLWSVAQFHDPHTGFTSLIHFGDMFEAQTMPAVKALPRHIEWRSAGYDGQFYAQMATDPVLRDPATDHAMDDAPLRARRILFAWTAYVAGLGHPPWILQAYALQNVVNWMLLSVLLLRWFPPVTARMLALWFASLFTGGLIWSVRSALLDGPSLTLLALGMVALERGRGWLSAGIFGLAGLGRETNLLAVATQLGPNATTWRTIVRQTARIAIVVLPLVIWFDYIYSIHRNLVYTTGSTLSLPLVGYVWKWNATLVDLMAHGWPLRACLSLLTLIAISVQAVFLVCTPSWKDAWWRLGFAYAVLMPLLGRPLWEGDPGTAVRVLLPMALAFNVLLRRCERPYRFWPLLVAGNLTIVQGVVMLEIPFLSHWR